MTLDKKQIYWVFALDHKGRRFRLCTVIFKDGVYGDFANDMRAKFGFTYAGIEPCDQPANENTWIYGRKKSA